MPRVKLLTLAALVAPVALAAQQPTAAPAAPPAPATVAHDSVRGEIHAVDVRGRTLDVKTGVGFALRIVRLQVPAGLPITDRVEGGGQREQIALNALKPGDLIRATFGGRPTGFVAYIIERIGRMDTGVEPTP